MIFSKLFMRPKHEKSATEGQFKCDFASDIPLTKWNGNETRPITVNQYMEPQLHPDNNNRKMVLNTRSFADLLAPRIDLDNGYIGLQDLTSVGRIFEVHCTSLEAKSENTATTIQERVHRAISNCIPTLPKDPWIVQWFIQDESEELPRTITEKMSSYRQNSLENLPYYEHWLSVLNQHFTDLTHPKGLFPSEGNYRKTWRGKYRRIRMCIWRKSQIENTNEDNNIDEVCEQLISSLAEADIELKSVGAKELYEWLTHWFVPHPEPHTGYTSTFELLNAYPWNSDDKHRAMSLLSNSSSADISRASLHGTAPWTWKSPGIWWFREQPSRFVSIDELTAEPEIGHLTVERQFGDSLATLWDQMPEKSIWSMTVVYISKDEIENKIIKVKKNSVGDDAAAIERRKLANSALNEIVKGNPIYRVFAGVYLFGSDLQQLNKRTERVLGLLTAHHLRPVAPRYDPIALDSYIRALPFGYNTVQDDRPYTRRAKLWYSSHIARVIPVFGRSMGSSNPGCILFNRSAEPLMFDPLDSRDREKNAHSLILGPTGSGKTAFLIYFLLQIMAIHKPRVVLLSALSTFGLFAKHCERMGLSVHHLKVDGKHQVSLPPFKHAQVLLNNDYQQTDLINTNHRDALGEMEIQARLMITGGQPNEEAKLRRDDLNIVRSALIEAAKRSKMDGREQTLTSDLVNALHDAASKGLIADHYLSAKQKERAAQMAGAINVFCTGMNGMLFDQEGDYWPESDISIVELDLLARRGYEDRLAVALTGLFSSINNLIERYQNQNRQTIVVIDEAHVLLQNPLISPYINRISAMWRTFGAWLWIATQNIRQFPDNAKELLNQPEWWYCLSMDKDEIDQISRFKSLTKPQQKLLQSTRKSPGQYTEGTLISPRLVTLFRNTPPALALALGQTEKNEKARRSQLMKEHQISEIEAAYLIAEEIRQQRINSGQA